MYKWDSFGQGGGGMETFADDTRVAWLDDAAVQLIIDAMASASPSSSQDSFELAAVPGASTLHLYLGGVDTGETVMLAFTTIVHSPRPLPFYWGPGIPDSRPANGECIDCILETATVHAGGVLFIVSRAGNHIEGGVASRRALVVRNPITNDPISIAGRWVTK